MKFLVVAIIFAFADAYVITDTKCIVIHNINYEKEVLKDKVESPYQLAIDHDTNTLFYSYSARSDQMFKSAYLSLKTGEYGIVGGIRAGFANAVNSNSHIVYMGGEDGIYQYNYQHGTAERLPLKENANIWQMFYKDGLYFTTYPEEKAYLYKNFEVVEVPEVRNTKVMLIAVNSENNLVYSNSSGVFMYDKDADKVIHLSDAVANGITADIDGNLYFTTPNGIYFVNDGKKQAEQIASLINTYGVAIEGNGNIIYASEEGIFRFKPTKKQCTG